MPHADRAGVAALAVVGLFNIAGSLGCGWLGGRYRQHTCLGWLYLVRSATIVAFFLLPKSELSVLLFAAVMGLAWLGAVPLTSGLVARVFGTRHLGTLFGVCFLNHQAGSFLGAWLGGDRDRRRGGGAAAFRDRRHAGAGGGAGVGRRWRRHVIPFNPGARIGRDRHSLAVTIRRPNHWMGEFGQRGRHPERQAPVARRSDHSASFTSRACSNACCGEGDGSTTVMLARVSV